MHAGWSARSQMHLKYLHYFGNESSDSILEVYGIVTKDQKQLDSDRKYVQIVMNLTNLTVSSVSSAEWY